MSSYVYIYSFLRNNSFKILLFLKIFGFKQGVIFVRMNESLLWKRGITESVLFGVKYGKNFNYTLQGNCT